MNHHSNKISLLEAILKMIILKETNDSLTRNDEVLETVNEDAETNFNEMLHNNVQCVTANYAIVGCMMQSNI